MKILLIIAALFIVGLYENSYTCEIIDSQGVEGMQIDDTNPQADLKPITMNRKLTELEKHVLIDKGTEAPFTGQYCEFMGEGTYHCRQCGAPLFRSEDKFNSSCGWPSFDDQIEGALRRTPDVDGRRVEITCANCGGHLGHVFGGEGFTKKDTRHCVNSVSMTFVPRGEAAPVVSVESVSDLAAVVDSDPVAASETAIFAGGCFWGVEHLMLGTGGVLSTEVGYIGGAKQNPTYQDVCTGRTGHAEALKVVFDPSKVSFERLAKLFLEIHDPTQQGGQGPDIGDQYRSEIFYTNEVQRAVAQRLIRELKRGGYDVVTAVTAASTFYPAEDYHQQYYSKKGTQPYCHTYQKRF